MRPIRKGAAKGRSARPDSKLPSGGLREIRTSRRGAATVALEKSLPTTTASLHQVAARKCATPIADALRARASARTAPASRRIAAEACHTWCRRAAAAANAHAKTAINGSPAIPAHACQRRSATCLATSRRDAARRARPGTGRRRPASRASTAPVRPRARPSMACSGARTRTAVRRRRA